MALNIPGGEFLTGSLDVISQSLTIPVLVILLVALLLAKKRGKTTTTKKAKKEKSATPVNFIFENDDKDQE